MSRVARQLDGGSLVVEHALLKGPSTEPSGTEGEVVVTRKQIVCELLHHVDCQLPVADGGAKKSQRGDDLNAILLSDRARDTVVEHDLVAADPTKGQHATLSTVPPVGDEPVFVSREGGQELQVGAAVHLDPRCVKDLPETWECVDLLTQLVCHALGHKNDSITSEVVKDPQPALLSEVA